MKKRGRPEGRSPYVLKRNVKIRNRYRELVDIEKIQANKAYIILSNEFDLSPITIQNIIYRNIY